jgi:hypothetical protein
LIGIVFLARLFRHRLIDVFDRLGDSLEHLRFGSKLFHFFDQIGSIAGQSVAQVDKLTGDDPAEHAKHQKGDAHYGNDRKDTSQT